MSGKSSYNILDEKVLRIAANPSRPYIYWNETNRIESDPKDGIEYGIIETLSDYYKFKYNITFCDYEWGLKLANGSWTGIIGKLVANECDIGVSGITMTTDRLKAVDFSIPFLFSPITFITSSISAHYSQSVVIDAFNANVWFLIIFSYIFVAFVSKIIAKRYSLELSQLWSLAFILLCQGLPKNRPVFNIDSLRILYSAWILSVMILSVGYAASLTMFMAIQTKDPINSIEKLALFAKIGRIKVVAEEGSLYMDIIKRDTTNIYNGIGEKMFSVPTPEQALKYVREKNYAYVASRDSLMVEMQKMTPNTYYLPPVSEKTTFFVEFIAMAFNSKFNAIIHFNKMIRLLIEGGFLIQWKRISVAAEVQKFEEEMVSNSEGSDEPSNSELIGLNVYQLQSAFYLNIFGILIALIVLFIEILSFYIKHKYLMKGFRIEKHLSKANKIPANAIYNNSKIREKLKLK